MCNVMAIRLVEERRSRFRLGGRRRIDGRAWVEGSQQDAGNHGWVVDDDGHDVCAKCHEKGLDHEHFQYVRHQPLRDRFSPYS